MNIVNWKEILYPYEQAVKELELKFRSIASGFRDTGEYSPIEIVYGRVKDRASIISKADKKNIPLDRVEEELEDLAGIRIIVRFVEDVYRVVNMIKQRDKKDLTIIREKDYIVETKPSGYRSYHIIVKYPITTFLGYRELAVEIQIRTMSMNFWATAEHSLNYKYNGNIPPEIQSRLRACAEAAFNLDDEMNTIRGEIMEAEMIIQRKNNLVQEILDNFKALYKVDQEEDSVDELTRNFFDIYDEGDLKKLSEFNDKLSILTELYNS